MIKLADRYSHISEYYFSQKLREIAQLKEQGHDIINLGIGSPDLAPPGDVIQELIRSSRRPEFHGYQPYKGLPQLRDAFAQWYRQYYEVSLDPEYQILPLMGSKEGITYISNAYLNPDDEVLVPNPGYPSYGAAAKIAGAKPVYYDLKEENAWLPQVVDLERLISPKVKLMWINYPHMPTGARADEAKFQELIDFTRAHNILLCHDNPYSFILNNKPASIFSSDNIHDHVLELNSLSKSHNLAGWRIGVLVGVKYHIDNILVAKSNVDSGMSYAVQQGAIAALRQGESWYKNLNGVYHQRKITAKKILDSLNCSYAEDSAGLFVWGKVCELKVDIMKYADEILHEAHVFITPGSIFGTNGEGYLRISLCVDKSKLTEALKRIINIKN